MFTLEFKNLYIFMELMLTAVHVQAGVNPVQEMQMSNIQVGRFKWNNCDDKYYPMNFSSFSIQPDPVIPGEYIIASFILDVFEDIGTTNTLKADFELVLTTQGTRVDLCRYKEISKYCHMENVCKLLQQYRKKCSDMIEMFRIDCKCPLKENRFVLPPMAFRLPDAPIDGTFYTKIKVTESDRVMGCLSVEICIRSCSGQT